MIYIDLTPLEIEKLNEFHKEHPNSTIRVYNSTVNEENKVEMIAKIIGTNCVADIHEDLD